MAIDRDIRSAPSRACRSENQACDTRGPHGLLRGHSRAHSKHRTAISSHAVTISNAKDTSVLAMPLLSGRAMVDRAACGLWSLLSR
jgi:hypothetical protein